MIYYFLCLVAMAEGKHPYPSRTRRLSPPALMVLGPQGPGRVSRCQAGNRLLSRDRGRFGFCRVTRASSTAGLLRRACAPRGVEVVAIGAGVAGGRRASSASASASASAARCLCCAAAPGLLYWGQWRSRTRVPFRPCHRECAPRCSWLKGRAHEGNGKQVRRPRGRTAPGVAR